MRSRAELAENGWVRVHGISSQTALLELAASLGSPVPSPTGELVKRLRVREWQHGRRRTLTAQYGTGKFPMHTDTAFWPVPARFLVFRVLGDTRRQTTVRLFYAILNQGGTRALAERSLWLVRTPSASFYCPMKFRCDADVGWRYDRECMYPANGEALELAQILESEKTDSGEPIGWADGDALVISNWDALHARGPAPLSEGDRILERIYVR